MVAATFDDLPDPFRRRRKRTPAWIGWAVLGVIVVALAALFWLRGPTITGHDSEHKIINVVLPPPPSPPPPPPPKERPPEPEKPTPIDEPKPTPETPPPPTPQQQPTPGDNALTARTGAGPTNYGLAQGNGSGTRIGGAAGGDNGFGAYALTTVSDIRRAAQADKALAKGHYSARLLVTVGTDGRIASVRVLNGTGDGDRDRAIEQRLTGLQLSRQPPAGLPPMRIDFNTGAGS